MSITFHTFWYLLYRHVCPNRCVWCEDWYDAMERSRVLRGASWNVSGRDVLLASFRISVIPVRRIDDFGVSLCCWG